MHCLAVPWIKVYSTWYAFTDGTGTIRGTTAHVTLTIFMPGIVHETAEYVGDGLVAGSWVFLGHRMNSAATPR